MSIVYSHVITSKEVGPQELVNIFLSLSTLSTGIYGSSTPSPNGLADFEVPRFLQDIIQRFGPEGGLAEILGPVIAKLLFHPCLFREEGLAASDPQWRGVLTGLEALVAHKEIAAVITKMDEWNPSDATAATFETKSLMGPLLRLNVFSREWVRETQALVEVKLRPMLASSHTSLRYTSLAPRHAELWILNHHITTFGVR